MANISSERVSRVKRDVKDERNKLIKYLKDSAKEKGLRDIEDDIFAINTFYDTHLDSLSNSATQFIEKLLEYDSFYETLTSLITILPVDIKDYPIKEKRTLKQVESSLEDIVTNLVKLSNQFKEIGLDMDGTLFLSNELYDKIFPKALIPASKIGDANFLGIEFQPREHLNISISELLIDISKQIATKAPFQYSYSKTDYSHSAEKEYYVDITLFTYYKFLRTEGVELNLSGLCSFINDVCNLSGQQNLDPIKIKQRLNKDSSDLMDKFSGQIVNPNDIIISFNLSERLLKKIKKIESNY